MTYKETKTRSIIKSMLWRVVAFTNSWIILSLAFSPSAFYNALFMNITGLIVFYFYERVWNNIQKGKYTE
jgi:uncharacterized membrane protein